MTGSQTICICQALLLPDPVCVVEDRRDIDQSRSPARRVGGPPQSRRGPRRDCPLTDWPLRVRCTRGGYRDSPLSIYRMRSRHRRAGRSRDTYPRELTRHRRSPVTASLPLLYPPRLHASDSPTHTSVLAREADRNYSVALPAVPCRAELPQYGASKKREL